MNCRAPLGFVTGCHIDDIYMVKATLASMRYYCPNMPICLVADGDFDVNDLASEYNLIVLRIADLPSEEMRRFIGGNYRAKLAALWEGPFEHFIWIDSDAIVWGDFTSHVRFDWDFQIFWKDVPVNSDVTDIPFWLSHYYFDPIMLAKYDPEFIWQGHVYFCSGAFASKRNAITFSEWLKVEKWVQQTPNLFAWGEMGMLNYIIHSKATRGLIKVGISDLQDLWAFNGTEELEKDCFAVDWRFPKSIRRPRVAHFCGRKPNILDPKSYSRPFTIARLEHYRLKSSTVVAFYAIFIEDLLVYVRKLKMRIIRYSKFVYKP